MTKRALEAWIRDKAPELARAQGPSEKLRSIRAPTSFAMSVRARHSASAMRILQK